MKRRVEAHFGFIVGLMGKHEACLGAAYFTPRGQSYPQAWPDFRGIGEGLFAANIINQLKTCESKWQTLSYSKPTMVGAGFCPVSD